jgi:hypothetical protein
VKPTRAIVKPQISKKIDKSLDIPVLVSVYVPVKENKKAFDDIL